MTRRKCTQYQLHRILVQIRQLLDENKTTKEIAEIKKIPLRTVVFYVKRIYDQEKTKWQEMEKESLISRAQAIKRKYEELAEISESIMYDEKRSARDRIEAGRTMIACHNNIYNMLNDGPLRFSVCDNSNL